MPVLVQGQPVQSASPTFTVENRLDPGRWRFRLVVVDNANNESAPNDLVVVVGPLLVRPNVPIPPRIDPRILVRPLPPIIR